jgi:hypothetical protein
MALWLRFFLDRGRTTGRPALLPPDPDEEFAVCDFSPRPAPVQFVLISRRDDFPIEGTFCAGALPSVFS